MTENERNDIDFLWKSFLNGDEKSFSFIYQQSVNGLICYGMKFTTERELIHDCIQEVFITLFTRKKELGAKIKKIKPYLFVSVRNEIVNRIVKENKYRKIQIEEINNTLDFRVEYNSEEKFIKEEISSEISQQLLAAVNNLAPRQKEIIYLKFEEELEYNDIAEIMQISVESARKSMHRAIGALRNLLENSS